jgi:putative ABC transport system permease protein
VAVISEDTRDRYFGKNTQVTGKYIEVNNTRYRICGVVENVSITSPFTYSDIYLPYTLPTSGYGKTSLGGAFTAIILAKRTEDIPAIQQEYKAVLKKIPLAGQEYDKIVSAADFYAASLLRNALGNENSSGVTTLIVIVNILALFFILLPALNLMNITVSRMIERSSEIGVRKAFGASSATLVYQFIIENLILTGIGGLLGLAFSALFLMAFNHSGIVPNISLGINYAVLGYALIAVIVLGLLSGVYPAWRMSRLQIVNSLKIQR